MMSCREVSEKASAHLDGELSARQRMGIRLHLAMCRHCRRFLRQLRATVHALGALREREPTATSDEEARLLALFRRRDPP